MMEEQTKPKIGRPSMYRDAYDVDIIAMAKEGKGPAEWAAAFDVTKQTLHNWKAAHPTFLDAYTRAETHLQAWWESAGRIGMLDRNFNAAVWSRNMGARFRDDWKEHTKQEIVGADGAPLIPVLNVTTGRT